jgi:hypothetical protein
MSEVIDELLDTLDSLDKGLEGTKIAKQMILVTNGNKMGDKYPITHDNINAWLELKREYAKAVRAVGEKGAIGIHSLLMTSTLELIGRSFTSKNEFTLAKKLSKRWTL